MSFLLTSFQIQLQAGISDINNKESISNAYLQADTALEYQRLFEAKKIYNYQCIPKDQIIGSVPLNTSEYLKTLVISCDAHKIKDYFHTLNEKLANNPLSHTDAKSCFYFFYQVTAQLQLYYQTHYAFEIESLNFISESFFEQSLPKALSQTCEAYLKACDEFISKSANSSNTYWARNICRFIENNYFDTNLNLNSIANHFQISPAYLSKKFKEQYQQSVIDYLYEVRITTAVSLLLETNLKISDIATMSGFVDSNAFIRIFKKIKGTTPGKYKDTVEGIL